MSTFYQSLSYRERLSFRRRKQAFKKGKPCTICGKKFPSSEMMVAHIVPVRELSDLDALYNTKNWEVRCIQCERKLNHEEDLRRSHVKKSVSESEEKFIPSYELDICADYNVLVQHIWERASAGLKPGKKYRRSLFEGRIARAVKVADRMTLAKSAARFVLSNNGKMPTQDEVYEMLLKDLETKMLVETRGKFRKEKIS